MWIEKKSIVENRRFEHKCNNLAELLKLPCFLWRYCCLLLLSVFHFLLETAYFKSKQRDFENKKSDMSFLVSDEAEAWHMEAMVHYIRFAIARIDGLPMETIVLRPESINWPMPEEFT